MLKQLASRVRLNDSGIFLSLLVVIVLLVFGAVKLNEQVAASMLRTDAESTSTNWVATLMASADVSTLVDGTPPWGETKHLLETATRVGDIYRYKIWNTKGDLVFSSQRMTFEGSEVTPSGEVQQRIAEAIRSGAVKTETHLGELPENTPHFAKSYIPIKKDGAVIGVFEVNLDQTSDHRIYETSFLRIEVIIALAVVLAGGFPAFLVYRKMLAHRTAQAEALFLTHHDSLTGIANRKWLSSLAKTALALANRNKTYVAVLLLDLDRFAHVNDTFGYGTGDEVLKEVALRLKSSVRAQDLVARVGGDEFVIVQVGMAQPNGARSLATRLLEILSAPYTIAGVQVDCGTSIGVSIAPPDATEWDALLRCAGVALSKAKAEDRNSIRFYEAGMDAIFRERQQLETDLRRALDTGAFQLAYQPIYRLRDNSIVGFETLLRWPRGWTAQSPKRFIPVAEESGLIVPIGGWVLRAACQAAATWPKPVKVAVNLSAVQFRHGDIVATVEEALEASGLDPRRLELEVTESIWIQDTETVLGQLARLRAMGISIALDDFGTGYSSLSYLWKFPFDVVKIDRSFVSDLKSDSKANAIVNTVVALGKTLSLTVTAEGVETEAQAQALIEAGCDQVQGFLFGMPLSPESAMALIDEESEMAARILDNDYLVA